MPETSTCPYSDNLTAGTDAPTGSPAFDPTFIPKIFFIKKSNMNVSKPDARGEMIHPRPISPRTLKLIFRAPLYKPIPKIQPTITCELETGTMGMGGRPAFTNRLERPVDEKIKSTRDRARTTTRAASDDSSRILLPIVSMTFHE